MDGCVLYIRIRNNIEKATKLRTMKTHYVYFSDWHAVCTTGNVRRSSTIDHRQVAIISLHRVISCHIQMHTVYQKSTDNVRTGFPPLYNIYLFLTARRYDSAVYAVRLPVTSLYSAKMAKYRITKTMSYDSLERL